MYKSFSIVLFLSFISFLHVTAQEANPPLSKPEPCDVYFGLIPKGNSVCFLRKYRYDAQRVKQVKPKSKLNDPARRQQVKKEKINAQFQQRRKERMQKAIEHSRARNISNKGMRYRVTFGRVLEPQVE